MTVELGEPLGRYWRERLATHEEDSYAGVGLSKFPEDLRVYEHLIWSGGCDTVIEIGAQRGGSALWFRDRLRAFSHYRASGRFQVISIELDAAPTRASLSLADPAWEQTITVLDGDVRDPHLPEIVAGVLGPRARCFVVEDSAHEYETTLAALEGFARFVPPGGYFVVEDGCVDVEELRVKDGWPRGVLPAIDAWLAGEQGSTFRRRRDLERYGVTCHVGGFLQRSEDT